MVGIWLGDVRLVTSTKRLGEQPKRSATPRSFASGLIENELCLVDSGSKTGCLVVDPYLPLLKNDGVKVSWDDEIPKIWKITRGYFLLIPPFWWVNSL